LREQIVDEDDLVEKLMNDNLLPNADILAVVESLKPKEKTVEEIAHVNSPKFLVVQSVMVNLKMRNVLIKMLLLLKKLKRKKSRLQLR